MTNRIVILEDLLFQIRFFLTRNSSVVDVEFSSKPILHITTTVKRNLSEEERNKIYETEQLLIQTIDDIGLDFHIKEETTDD